MRIFFAAHTLFGMAPVKDTTRSVQHDLSIRAAPRNFSFPQRKTALVIIDMQRDFVEDGGYGSYQCPSKEVFKRVSSIVPTVQRLLNKAREIGLEVIHTREGHLEDLTDCHATKLLRQSTTNPARHGLKIGDRGPLGRLLVQGEYGHDIIDSLKPLKSEIVLDKPAKGSFCNTNLYQILTSRGITHLLFCGVTTECCVATTFREANDRGFEGCVIKDCTGGFDDLIVEQSFRGFSAYDGLFGYVAEAEDVMAAFDLYSITPSASSTVFSYDVLRSNYLQSPDILMAILTEITQCLNTHSNLTKNLLLNDYVLQAKHLLNTIERENLPYFFGVPFFTTDDIKSSSKIVCDIISQGGIHLGIIPGDQTSKIRELIENDACTFVLTTSSNDAFLRTFTDGLDDSRKLAALVPSYGSISARGIVYKCPSFDKLAIVATGFGDIRHVWSKILSYDSSDPFSSHYRSLPTPAIDFRGFGAGKCNCGVLSEEMMFDLPQNLKTAYEIFLEKLARHFTLKTGELDLETWRKASTDFQVLYAQELLCSAYEGRITCGVERLTNLKSSEIPAWEFCKIQQNYRKLGKVIQNSFEGSDGYDLVLLPCTDEFACTLVNSFDSSYSFFKEPMNTRGLSLIAVAQKGMEHQLVEFGGLCS